jgi:hypothetical protein
VFLRKMNAKIKRGVNTMKGRKRDQRRVWENGKGKIKQEREIKKEGRKEAKRRNGKEIQRIGGRLER